MLDIRYVREHAAQVERKAKTKGFDVDVSALLKLDDQRRELQTQLDELRKARNEHAHMFKATKVPSSENISKGRELKEQIATLEDRLRIVDDEFTTALKKIPNMPLDYVPLGTSEEENVVEKTVGEPRTFEFTPLSHASIEEQRGWLDKTRAAKVAGSRFAYIKGDLVRLQLALLQWVIDVLTSEKTLQKK